MIVCNLCGHETDSTTAGAICYACQRAIETDKSLAWNERLERIDQRVRKLERLIGKLATVLSDRERERPL